MQKNKELSAAAFSARVIPSAAQALLWVADVAENFNAPIVTIDKLRGAFKRDLQNRAKR